MDIKRKKDNIYIRAKMGTSIISALMGIVASIISLFFTERNFSALFNNKYFFMIISVIMAIALIIFVSIIIYRLQRKRKNERMNLIEKIKNDEKEFLLIINDNINRILSVGAYNEWYKN